MGSYPSSDNNLNNNFSKQKITRNDTHEEPKFTKPLITLPTNSNQHVKDMKAVFCIDNSGSTKSKLRDNQTILSKEIEMAKTFGSFFSNSKYISWNNNSSIIDDDCLDFIKSDDETLPSCLFSNRASANIIKESEILIIMTDGEIEATEINSFGQNILEHGSHLKVIIGIIFGSQKKYTPGNTNISVLLPAIITDGCILFFDGLELYLMYKSGSYNTNISAIEITAEKSWSQITKCTIETITDITIPIPDEKQKRELFLEKYIPFGGNCLFFNSNILLSCKPSWNILFDYPFDKLCNYFKIIQKCEALDKWFSELKNLFFKSISKDDIDAKNMEMILIVQDSDKKGRVDLCQSSKLDPIDREKYINTRNAALIKRYANNIEELENLITDEKIKKYLDSFHKYQK